MSKGWKTFFTLTVLGFLSILVWEVVRAMDDSNAVVLTVWNQPVEGRTRDRELWMDTVRQFEKKYKVKVKPISRSYIQQQFTTVMASGKGPDVVHVQVGAIQTLARRGFLAPLDNEVKGWSQFSQIPEVLWEPARVDGRIYAVPYDSYFYTLLIRKDLYTRAGFDPASPPRNWAELALAARRMTDASRDQYGFGFTPSTNQFMDFVWQAGGSLVEWENGKWHAAFHQNPGITALTFLRDLRFEQGVMQPNPLANEAELAQLFALGQLGMIMGVANQMPDLISRYGMDTANLIIAPLPAGPTGVQASHSGGDYFIVNAKTTGKRKAAAWAYIEHVLSPLNQLGKWKYMKNNNMPIYPGAFSVTINLVNFPEFKLVNEVLGYARVEPNPANWPLIKDTLDSLVLQKIFIDPDSDVEETLAEAAWEVEERYFK